VTGADAFARFQDDEKLIDKMAGDLRTNARGISQISSSACRANCAGHGAKR